MKNYLLRGYDHILRSYILGDKFHHLLADRLSNKQQGLYGVVLLTDDKETLFACHDT